MDGEHGDRDGGRQPGLTLPTRRRARHRAPDLPPAPQTLAEQRPDDDLLRRVLDGLLPR